MCKAIVVGINTYENFPQSSLDGCVDDALDVVNYLLEKRGFAHKDVLPLFNDRATKRAILDALRHMIRSSGPGDHLLLHFSGHGAQMVSRDEPGGLDEVICPVDFDWHDPDTALSDKELDAVLATVPSGTALTVVLDACRSGNRLDASRKTAGKPRFLPPPPDVARLLAAKERALHRRSSTHPNVVVVSACSSSEEAIDASFNGCANGAFTFNWLARVTETPEASLDALIKDVAAPLASFAMHPEVEGLPELRARTFLCAPPPVSRTVASRTLVPTVGRAPPQVVFDEGWDTTVLGLDVGVSLRILMQDGGFEFGLFSNAGVPLCWPLFRVNGDTVREVPIGSGLRLLLKVGDWTISGENVGFDLAIEIAMPFSFGQITITRQHLTIPLGIAERSSVVPVSAADLLAMVQSMRMRRPVVSLNGATGQGPPAER